MAAPAKELQSVDQLSELAFGFMASKGLFVALDLGLFTHLQHGPKSVAELSGATGAPTEALIKVLEVCAASGIVVRVRGDGAEGEDGHGMGTAPTQATRYRNSAAARSFLVKGSRHDFGDYYRLQIDKQFYPLLTRLYASLGLSGDRGPHETGTAAPLKANSRWYEELIAASDKEAAIFTEAQHAGSVGPARYLAKLLNLQGNRRVLDVAGGSGAFSIALAQRNPAISCVVFDFPRVIQVAGKFIREAGLSRRVSTLGGNAMDPWAKVGADVVLMSYILSALHKRDTQTMLQRAWDTLPPGGLLIVHDFMMEEGAPAASWLLAHQAVTPGSPALTSVWVEEQMQALGFQGVQSRAALPSITKFVFAHKPPVPKVPWVLQQPVQSSSVSTAPPVSETFRTSHYVRYNECDMQGVVFNSNYQLFTSNSVDDFIVHAFGRNYCDEKRECAEASHMVPSNAACVPK